MISAGLLGGPGIGYKQDYFATAYLKGSEDTKQTYERYKVDDEHSKDFPFVSLAVKTATGEDKLPAIAGLTADVVGMGIPFRGVAGFRIAG